MLGLAVIIIFVEIRVVESIAWVDKGCWNKMLCKRMKDSILVKTLHYLRNKKSYTLEERKIIKKALLEEAEAILARLVDKMKID